MKLEIIEIGIWTITCFFSKWICSWVHFSLLCLLFICISLWIWIRFV